MGSEHSPIWNALQPLDDSNLDGTSNAFRMDQDSRRIGESGIRLF